MKLPSLQTFVHSIRIVLWRFPLEIGFALLGTVAATVFIEISDLNMAAESLCVRLILTANLGLVLSLSLSLLSESNSYSVLKKNLFRLIMLVFIVGVFFLIDPLKRETDFFRFILMALAFHLSVSFAAYFGKGHINAFWQFNRIIFLRFLIGGIYSAALFLGLAAAIGSMNFLFNFKFEWDTFAILWVWIAGIFQTVFFLSGVPANLNDLEEDKTYPGGLKIFTQFVLIPLATVYAIILLAYEAKILIEWELPKGLVSNLILGYAVFGILSLLLIYPVRDHDENKWLKTFSRSFYYVLIPLILLLVWAVLARVIDYGITEERYFLIILAAWLAFINAYFLLSKSQNIMIIPFSLCLVTVLSIYGPQGAFSTSRRSQINELKQLFEKHRSLEGDKIIKLKIKPGKDDMTRMINIVDYLVNMHGLESFSPILKWDPGVVADSLLSVNEKKKYDSRTSNWEIRSRQKLWLYTYLNLQPNDARGSKLNLGMNMAEAFYVDLLPLNDADYMLPLNISTDTLSNTINSRKLLISRVVNQNKLKVIYGSVEKYIILDTLINQLDVELKKQKLADKQAIQVSRQLLSQDLEFDGLSLQILFNRINFNDNKDLLSADAYVLIKLK
ncbi:MAG: hypothetical protein B7X86_04090 [Sphingobacteriales bacterium 17-39-43]|uniref:DUF4153 domain-containing protein n=1 Tax=Daejeonella sp. TaxID=2805397 RepID=UPI000BCD036C|nr:DUF4153 domain-containing protein [Daejeonella sp.]OYZ32517.1 MAG: hypothetical protein B7Y24_04915 [Sphingobacteriales bacterium 16-39-50]OZA25880.1 MAG: hypothetical protein B7X86_04090 [Sphingobacteriales bacterium 17-39-43]HQT21922.1 DUF4153 domain-containing protein [Daejeonella sp.]HQT57229.1 DUF4153 domain-containing protein [Daejeonella sp.]